jgi:hypothetical protein
MTQPSLLHRLLRGDLAIIFYLSLTRLVLHLLVNASGGYGLFRDELYYLACADHLAAGYVDQPPFSLYILRISKTIFGDSLFAIRLVPAFAGALTVFLTGLMTIRMGGNKFAQFLACLCSFSIITLAMNLFYSMNSIDILLWTAIAYTMLRIIQDENKKLWIIAGLLLGVGLLNKIGVLFLGAGLFVGLLLTPQRKWLATPWPYLAGIIAFVIFSPYIIWNLQHDLAHLEFIHNASASKYSSLSPVTFIKDQFMMNNPVASVVWITGLLAFFFNAHLKKYRLLAFLYLGPFIIFIVNGTSKGEYLAPAYGILWASGSIALERLTAGKRFAIALRTVLCILILSWTAIALPMVLPILPVEKYIAYAKAMGTEPSSSEAKKLAELPQFYADMFGWDQKAADVAAVYNTLSEEEKQKCAIFGDNYGRCGAIDYYGAQYGLPKSIGNHNNYWIWGRRGYTGEIVIIMGGSYEDHSPDFETVELAATSDCQYCMPYEDNMKIFLCRKLKVNLKEIWDEDKHYE